MGWRKEEDDEAKRMRDYEEEIARDPVDLPLHVES